MSKPRLTTERIVAAFIIALVADAIDIVISAGEDVLGFETLGVVFIPGEVASGGLDVAVGAAMIKLLGFHVLFLPAFLIELVPDIDAFPTWIGCVGYVVWERKKEAS